MEDLIAAIEQRLEWEAQSLSDFQATELREDVQGFIRHIQKNWENDDLVDDLCTAIHFQFIKHLWIDVTRNGGNQ